MRPGRPGLGPLTAVANTCHTLANTPMNRGTDTAYSHRQIESLSRQSQTQTVRTFQKHLDVTWQTRLVLFLVLPAVDHIKTTKTAPGVEGGGRRYHDVIQWVHLIHWMERPLWLCTLTGQHCCVCALMGPVAFTTDYDSVFLNN